MQFALLALGGVAWNIAGPMHPGDSGTGTKVEQMHEMLVDPAWYPAHVVYLLAVVLATIGLWAIHREAPTHMRRLAKVVAIISSAMVFGSVLHLFQALNAGAIADGHRNAMYFSMYLIESLAAVWVLAIAVLAVVGGLNRSVGNVVTAAICGAGSAGFAAAALTVGYSDLLDPLFRLGGLVGLWMIIIGISRAVGRGRTLDPSSHGLQPFGRYYRRVDKT